MKFHPPLPLPQKNAFRTFCWQFYQQKSDAHWTACLFDGVRVYVSSQTIYQWAMGDVILKSPCVMFLRGFFSVELVINEGSLSRKNAEKIFCASKFHYRITGNVTLYAVTTHCYNSYIDFPTRARSARWFGCTVPRCFRVTPSLVLNSKTGPFT
jgi:hypothetical protein